MALTPQLEVLDADLTRLLLDSVVDYALFVLDLDGNVASWNRGAERIKGWRPKEIIGRHFSVFYTPEDIAAQKPWQELEQALRDDRVEDEGWRVRKDGSLFWANVVISTLRDRNGRPAGFAKITRDLTARREAEAAGRDLAALLERERIGRLMQDGVIRTLFGLGLGLQALATEGSDPSQSARLSEAVDTLDEAIRELRQNVFHR